MPRGWIRMNKGGADHGMGRKGFVLAGERFLRW